MKESFFFIYGAINPNGSRPGQKSEAFVYYGRGSSLEEAYETFPVSAYDASKSFRDVRVGPSSRATVPRIVGVAEGGEHSCSWDIVFEDVSAWDKTMGWMLDLPGLQTAWAVGTMTARASGWVRFDGKLYPFVDVPGYGDHNWGTTFPSQWVWLQANSFSERGTAVALSGGKVPLGTMQMDAYMIGLLYHGKMITFRTQDNATIEEKSSPSRWWLEGETSNGLDRIAIDAECDPRSLFHLLVPSKDGMEPHAWESLMGNVTVTYWRRSSEADDWRKVFSETSSYSGVEYGD